MAPTNAPPVPGLVLNIPFLMNGMPGGIRFLEEIEILLAKYLGEFVRGVGELVDDP